MAFSFTSDDLVASIKLRGRLPTSQTTFTAARLLKLCDEEIALGLVPQLLAARENYFLYPYTQAIVSGTATYRVPNRAIGVKLKAVQLVDNSGNIANIPEISYEDRGNYTNSSSNTPVFYFQGNSVVLVPTPATTGQYTLSTPFFIRPNSLVPVASCAKITVIAGSTITVASTPSTFVSGISVDFIKADGGFECAAIDRAVTTVAGTTFTMTVAPPSTLAVGDYIALAGESPIPQLPAELHPLLSLRVTAIALEALGFVNEMAAVQKKLEAAQKAVESLLTPRSDGSAKKVVSRSGWRRSRLY